MAIKLEKLAKEAINLKRKYDMLANVVSDLDVFMREAVMVMIDIINMLHSTIDDLEERADIIEAVVLGKEPVEVLKERMKKKEIEKEERALPIVESGAVGGPKPPEGPPPVAVQPQQPQQAPSASGPPSPPALPPRMQLIFELRRALEQRRRKKS
ncbi:MAG: hypothetical protein Q6363_001435 [Candidatus Njordarchaeota archaeon]